MLAASGPGGLVGDATTVGEEGVSDAGSAAESLGEAVFG